MIRYDLGMNEEKNFIVTEDQFDQDHLGKCEAIMVLGNGYMGIRSATEESYTNEKRDTFVAGIFNRFDENEVTELANIADVIQMTIVIDGEVLDLSHGDVSDYKRQLNLRTGELTRSFTWRSPKGDLLSFVFRRFISMDELHTIGQQINITAHNRSMNIKIISGINGQVNNSGVQHFSEGDKRLYEKKFLQLVQTTTQSKIDVVVNTAHHFKCQEEKQIASLIQMDRRKIYYEYDFELKENEMITLEKISNIYTSRDKAYECVSLKELKTISYEHIKAASEEGYPELFEKSKRVWENEIWANQDIQIESDKDYDQLAMRFAIYHLYVMTPMHDNRMNIAAKGLSGEGYKGHTFWDTEIFILPFWSYTNPKVARSLLEYRYLSLEGAHKKAKENGYEGAMFPWESAWLEDGEVTPVWGAADIITGKPTKIWSGFIEQHVTSDIAFAAWQYYKITHDEEFMENYGYEIFMDTAIFWTSRLEWNENKNIYEINDVVGPDEYKEHVNNNAFTNYMAHWTIKNAITYYKTIKETRTEVYTKLSQKLDLDKAYHKWITVLDQIYLPQANEELIIPQNDTYLDLKCIDLTKYKNQEHVGSMFKEYNLEQVNEIQVSKQADTMILLYLLEDLFSHEVKIANWNYYEPKTLHDSSLSLSTHCVLANDLGQYELAYDLFGKASEIDLGPNMKTSDHGIHAASIGGLWQCVVNGFGGVRMLGGILRIEPHLPATWKSLRFTITWQGDILDITVLPSKLKVNKKTKKNQVVEFMHKGEIYSCEEEIILTLNDM